MNPSPREFFRKHHEDDAVQLAITINEPWFRRAICMAQAEFSTGVVNSDIIKGGKLFVEALYSLAEDNAQPSQLPDHSGAVTAMMEAGE